jgi:hypothetical protein
MTRAELCRQVKCLTSCRAGYRASCAALLLTRRFTGRASGKRIYGLSVDGRAEVEGEHLLLQLTLESWSKRFREVREVAVPLREIDTFGLERRWFGSARVRLRIRDLRLLEDVPGSRGGELVLEIERKDRLLAEELISTAVLHASELRANEAFPETRSGPDSLRLP